MKKIPIKVTRFLGLPLVYAGVALLALFYLTGLSNYNWLMLIALLCIIAGIVGYIVNERKKSPY